MCGQPLLLSLEHIYDAGEKVKPLVANITQDMRVLLSSGYDVMVGKLTTLQESQLYKNVTNLETYANFSKQATELTKQWYNYVYYLSLELADQLFDAVNTGVDKIKANFDKPVDEL